MTQDVHVKLNGAKNETLHRVKGDRNNLHTIKTKERCMVCGTLRRDCLLKYVTEGKREDGIKSWEHCEEDVSSYWMTLRKRKDTGN
jgi:hypothetical protein